MRFAHHLVLLAAIALAGSCKGTDPFATTSCTPNCAGRVCGNDGCGGRCGTCPGVCSASGVCTTPSSDGGSGADTGVRIDAGAAADAGGGADAGPHADAGAGSDAGQACDGGSCNNPPSGLLNPDYTTTWNPGILADTATGNPLGDDGLPVRTATCASVPRPTGDATSAIQTALNGCAGKNQVVALAAGTYSTSATITVPSGVVLRGAGSDAASGTTILLTSNAGPLGEPVLAIGTLMDAVCYDSIFDHSAQPLLSQDALKETSTAPVASATGFKAGDLALIDQADDGEVDEGDCTGSFKRTANYGVGERVEIAVVDVSNKRLTLTTPLHWTFKQAQSARISRMGTAATKWAGIESLLVQGGRPGSWAGKNAGGIDISNAAYCWVKDVQVDGTTSGMPIRLAGTYRCVIRDSHIHNSYNYGFYQDNYGIVLACGAADNLVENNIVRFLDKPILLNASGGGNVIAYNYADNSWSRDGNGDDGFQEVSIDCHCAFPHMELIEGNFAPHVGASTTHGNAGYLTFYRNYSSSQWSPSDPSQSSSAIVWSQAFVPQYANVEALQFDTPDLNMTVIGNVFGSTADKSLGLPPDLGTTSPGQGQPAATSRVYASSSPATLAIYGVDQASISWTSIWLHGNFDTVNKKVLWNASALTANLPPSTQNLPASLYRATRPAWWPAGSPWPWVGPDLTPMVGALPAKERSSAFDYYNSADQSCTQDFVNSNYCCRVGPACASW